MKLSELLAALPEQLTGAPPPQDPEITGLTADSRRVAPGALFVAIRGVQVDGHQFIADAVARGAAAVIGTAEPAAVSTGVSYIQVGEGRAAFGLLAAAWHGYPSRGLTVLGVTGTDGKTTTASLLAAMLRAAGHKVGLITTVSAIIGDERYDTGLHTTTPPADEVQGYLARMLAAGTSHAVLEVTSEGLAQHRVTGVDFDVAVITNITHDHLYAHGTLEAYQEAKTRLFRMLEHAQRKPGVPKVAVINAEDGSAERLLAATAFLKPPTGQRLTYAVGRRADVYAQDLASGPDGLRFTLRSPYGTAEIRSPLAGEYNAANILAAASAALALGVNVQDTAEGVAGLASIPGRMEPITLGEGRGQDFTVIVDFAHTANALEQALQAGRAWAGPGGRVIAVFGAAGERDVAKRPLMGAAAARRAELVVLTAEDPRSESAEAIIAALAEGCAAEGKREGEDYWREPDRGEAIRRAIAAARPGDVVMICGKGHEQSMAYGSEERPWDDRQAARAALAERFGGA